jgi:hypothetical protein
MSDSNDKTDGQMQQSPEGRALLRPAGRVLVGLAVLVLELVLAGGAYQAIAGVFILLLAVADEVYRFFFRRT